MNFDDLEKLMKTKGFETLADIARKLETTPQAVSNWKSRDQVPHHIVAKIRQAAMSLVSVDQSNLSYQNKLVNDISNIGSHTIIEEDSVLFSDILLILAEQIKVIILTTFISVFFTFSYVQLIKIPAYISWSSVLLPDNNSNNNLGGLAGLASQFGVSVPSASQADLSSPSLFPELLRSRTFAEKILEKKFYTNKFDKELSLLAILTHGNDPPQVGKDTLITQALNVFSSMVQFNKSTSSISEIKVIAFEPIFAKNLAEAVLFELQELNRYFKSQTLREKTIFIENRISSVNQDLESSEQNLKAFKEQNRQISSPSLLLDQDRLTRNLEIQKGIFLTLKQQLELAKIEEVQGASIVQILDMPQIPLGPSNINLKGNVLVALIGGLILGAILGFFRSYLNNDDMIERKKLRRVKLFIIKKTQDIISDQRVTGIVSSVLIIGLPFYLNYQSV